MNLTIKCIFAGDTINMKENIEDKTYIMCEIELKLNKFNEY